VKKNRYLLAILCLLLCFGIVYSASAATTLTAKQLLLDKLQSADLSIPGGQMYKVSSGTSSYQLKALSGTLISGVEPLNDLTGAKLDLDYKLNSSQKKLEAGYNLVYGQNTYEGIMYLNNDKLILSSDIFSLISQIDPSFNLAGGETLPEYIYISDKQIGSMWGSTLYSGQNIPEESRDLLIFITEAIPDQYFTTSLVNQNIILNLEENRLADVVASVMQKAVNEPERFAVIASGLVLAVDPTQNREKLKTEIISGLQAAKQSGIPSSGEIQEMMAEIVVVEELKFEASLLPSGNSALTMAVSFGGSSNTTGSVTLNVDTIGSKDNLSGTYALNVTVRDSVDKINVDGRISGEFKYTASNTTSKSTVSASVKDQTGTLLNLLLEINSDMKYDPGVIINVPALTASNSMSVEDFMPDGSLRVFVDGSPVRFDVEPFIQDGRTMAPVRNVAEVMGCQVNWVDPDQINILRDDISIKMYINKQTYTVNGVERQLDVPPFIKEGRTVVPLRFIAEGLGCTFEYQESTRTVYIQSLNKTFKQEVSKVIVEEL